MIMLRLTTLATLIVLIPVLVDCSSAEEYPKTLFDYSARHREALEYIIANGKPLDGAHYMVHRPGRTGMADQLTSLITNYAIAIATDTTFVIDWAGFSKYYICRDVCELKTPLSDDVEKEALFMSVGMPRRTGDYQKGLEKLAQMVTVVPVTIVGASHGGLRCIFSTGSCTFPGEKLKERLTGSILFEDAYRVLFNYLLEPTNLLRSALIPANPKLHEALQHADPSHPVTKVYLQIRVGDLAIRHYNLGQYGNITTEHEQKARQMARSLYECWRLCALRHIDVTTQPVMWVLMTDSNHIKDYAAKLYGETTIINNLTSAVTVHEYKNQALDPKLYVLAEQWLGTLCDIHVVTGHSGLGRQAAFRSGTSNKTLFYGRQYTGAETNWENLFNDEDLLSSSPKHPDSCWHCKQLTFRTAANDWSRI